LTYARFGQQERLGELSNKCPQANPAALVCLRQQPAGTSKAGEEVVPMNRGLIGTIIGILVIIILVIVILQLT
jgi:hypothetical protein